MGVGMGGWQVGGRVWGAWGVWMMDGWWMQLRPRLVWMMDGQVGGWMVDDGWMMDGGLEFLARGRGFFQLSFVQTHI